MPDEDLAPAGARTTGAAGAGRPRVRGDVRLEGRMRRAQQAGEPFAVGLCAATHLLPIGSFVWLMTGGPGGRAAPLALLLPVAVLQVALVHADRRRLAARGRPEHASMLGRSSGLAPPIHISRRARAAEAQDPDAFAWLWILTSALSCLTFAVMVFQGPRTGLDGCRATCAPALQDRSCRQEAGVAAGPTAPCASEPGVE